MVQSFLRWPGYLSTSANIKFADLPNGIAAFKAIPPAGLFQILLFIGAMEAFTWRYYEGPWPGKVPEGKAPGDVAGDLWVRYTDPEEKAFKLNAEINNGRAAMMGSLGTRPCCGPAARLAHEPPTPRAAPPPPRRHADARPHPRHVGAARLRVEPPPTCRLPGGRTHHAAFPAAPASRGAPPRRRAPAAVSLPPPLSPARWAERGAELLGRARTHTILRSAVMRDLASGCARAPHTACVVVLDSA